MVATEEPNSLGEKTEKVTGLPWMLVLNWNGAKRLSVSLGALRRMRASFELLLIDNGSTDGSLELLAGLYPRPMHVLKNGRNLGFAAGNNAGIRYALDRGATHVALINDDLAVDEDWLTRMLEASAAYPKAGILGGTILFLDRPEYINSTAIAVDAFYRAPDENFGIALAEVNLSSGPRRAVSGGAMFITREALTRVGLLDESYFAYFEDVDFCLRATRLGFEVRFVAEAKSWHMYGGSQAKTSVLKRYLLARNHTWTMAKHANRGLTLFAIPLFLLYRSFLSGPRALMQDGWKAALAEWRGAWHGFTGAWRRACFRREEPLPKNL